MNSVSHPSGGFPYEIRRAQPNDITFLTSMLLEAVNWDPARPQLSRRDVMRDRHTFAYVKGWGRPDDFGVIACDRAGEPVGAAWARTFPEDQPGYGFVSVGVPELSIGVVTRCRGKGLGRALLNELVRLAQHADHLAISLSVERSNSAHRLYLREGFVTVVSGKDADTMVKVLIE